jgi:hypothetical protein
MTRLAAIVVLAFALAGCGSGSSDNEAASPTTATTTTSTSPTTTSTSPPSMQTVPACMPPPSASTSPQKSSANENRETMYLTNVGLGGSDCVDTIVFDFEKQAPGPGYDISYQPASTAKIEDGSGNPIDVAGDAFLVVKLTPVMTAKIDGDQVTKTYTGPNRLTLLPGDSSVQDGVKSGDFESVVTWVIGLDSKRPFTTKVSDSRLVVEITSS